MILCIEKRLPRSCTNKLTGYTTTAACVKRSRGMRGVKNINNEKHNK